MKAAMSQEQIAKTMYRYEHMADNRIPTLADLGQEQVAEFQKQGYLIVDNVLSLQEIQSSLDALMDIVFLRTEGAKVQIVKPERELKTAEDREYAVRKVYDFVGADHRLKDIAEHSGVMMALQQIFDEKAILIQDQALLKPPMGGAEKPWHQDMAYGRIAYDRQAVGVWIALDEAGIDNGCMHIIPGTHQKGAVPHFSIRDWQLCDRHVDVNKQLAVPLNPGGVLFFSGLLHHGTPPNFSRKRRRALQFHYVPESAKKLTAQEYKLMFTNEMTGAEC